MEFDSRIAKKCDRNFLLSFLLKFKNLINIKMLDQTFILMFIYKTNLKVFYGHLKMVLQIFKSTISIVTNIVLCTFGFCNIYWMNECNYFKLLFLE